MKPVSESYKASMSALVRNRSYARIVFGDVNTKAARAGQFASNGEVSYSHLDTLSHDYAYGETYATLELNRWRLNGQSDILPNTDPRNDGYISEVLSGSTGEYSTSPMLTIAFPQRYTFPGLTLTFDSRMEEWPMAVQIDWYAGETLVDTLTVAPSGVKAVIEHGVEYSDKIVISAASTYPYRRFRLEEVIFGIEREYGNSELISLKESSDVDPISRRLPKETFSFTVLDYLHLYDPDNPEGVYRFIDTSAPIRISYGYELPNGKVEWLDPTDYVLSGRPSANGSQATFSGTRLAGTLTSTYYKDTVSSKTLYALATDVLTDAGLVDDDGSNLWELDESLRNITTSAVLPLKTHAECLQLIAHAGLCRFYTDSDGIVHLEKRTLPISGDTDFELSHHSIYENTQVGTKIPQLRNLLISKYSYAESTNQTLYEGETDDTELHIEFSAVAKDIQVVVTGGTLVSSEVYARAADLVLSEGTKTVKVTGMVMTPQEAVITTAVNADGEDDKIENPLITNDNSARALAAHIAAYLAYRSTYDMTYRGNPEVEVGDSVMLETPYTGAMRGMVLVHSVSFTGSLQGTMTVKGLV